MSHTLAKQVIQTLTKTGLIIRCAESCTGGLIMAELTSISGSSAVVDRGFVTYSNAAKQEMLGVQETTLQTYGAVSAETAFEMVQGVVNGTAAPAAGIAITGIAGPNGGSDDKPVGTVWIGTSLPDKEPLITHYVFSGDRDDVRRQSVDSALLQLMSLFSQ